MGNPYKARKKINEEVPSEEIVDDTVNGSEDTTETTTDKAPEAVPEGSAAEVLAWVGSDDDRAVAALSAEEAGKKRKTLIKALEEIIVGS